MPDHSFRQYSVTNNIGGCVAVIGAVLVLIGTFAALNEHEWLPVIVGGCALCYGGAQALDDKL